MANTFRCRLITPEAQVLDQAATSAVIPVWDGMIGVLANRAPMVMELGSGELRLDLDGPAKTRSFFVSDGFVQMLNNSLTILAASAVDASTLTEAAAQAELNAVEARQSGKLTDDEHEQLKKDKARAEAKLRVARSLKGQAA